VQKTKKDWGGGSGQKKIQPLPRAKSQDREARPWGTCTTARAHATQAKGRKKRGEGGVTCFLLSTPNLIVQGDCSKRKEFSQPPPKKKPTVAGEDETKGLGSERMKKRLANQRGTWRRKTRGSYLGALETGTQRGEMNAPLKGKKGGGGGVCNCATHAPRKKTQRLYE